MTCTPPTEAHVTELEEVSRVLSAHRDELTAAGVRSVYVFGSVARGEAAPGSDIDLLVEWPGPGGLIQFVRLKNRLEDLLGRPVDLVEIDALREPVRSRILAEAVRAA